MSQKSSPLRYWMATSTVVCTLAGCSTFMRSNQNESSIADVEIPQTVGEATRPHGLGVASVEAVGLVTGLNNTGSDPPPSQQRQMLIEEMKRRNVDRPHQRLADTSTALVLVRAKLPPGVRKGDPLDVEVRVPARSETSSLAGGWLMESQLREVAVLEQSLRSGHVRAVAEGPILLDAFTGDQSEGVSEVRGIILGGGVAAKSRPVGLHLRSEHHSVSMSKLVGNAINQRFDTYIGGKRQGAATPQTDRFIALEVHPRYRNNLIRFLRVIEQIPLRESQLEQIERIKQLEGDLLIPATAPIAALRLEAIGKDGIKALLNGLQSNSAEVRFYAAEALAYLDQDQAATELAAATAISAFRSRAFAALGAMSSVEAHDELSQLLHASSAETRYGAFCALREMNPRDALLGQDSDSSRIAFHQITSKSTPMVHVRRRERPEIIIFGKRQLMKTPLMIVVDKSIIVKNDGAHRLRVTRYDRSGEDQTKICPATVDELVRSLIEIDASYPDIVTVLQEAKQQGVLPARLEFDAVPEAGRIYSRDGAE